MTQQQMVLKHLEETGSIQPLFALRELGIYRLSSVIHRLRKKGYNIKTKIKHAKGKYGNKIQFAKYKLIKD